MRKRITIITLALVLIGLIFFAFFIYPREQTYDGVLIKTENIYGGKTG